MGEVESSSPLSTQRCDLLRTRALPRCFWLRFLLPTIECSVYAVQLGLTHLRRLAHELCWRHPLCSFLWYRRIQQARMWRIQWKQWILDSKWHVSSRWQSCILHDRQSCMLHEQSLFYSLLHGPRPATLRLGLYCVFKHQSPIPYHLALLHY